MMLVLLLVGALISNQLFLTSGSPLSAGPHQHAGFLDGVRDWLNNLKEKIFGTTNSKQILAPPDAEAFDNNFDRIDENEKFVRFGNFLVDLSTVTFNPEEDWGFRIGSWYIIKKNSDGGSDEGTPAEVSELLEKLTSP